MPDRIQHCRRPEKIVGADQIVDRADIAGVDRDRQALTPDLLLDPRDLQQYASVRRIVGERPPTQRAAQVRDRRQRVGISSSMPGTMMAGVISIMVMYQLWQYVPEQPSALECHASIHPQISGGVDCILCHGERLGP